MAAVAPEGVGPLFHSPRGLYSFQEDGVARAYLKMEQGGGILCTWETGLGKSILTLALAAMLFEDDLIDHVLLVAEKGKITDDEWPAEIARFTRLTHARHHGTSRWKRMERDGLPQVLVTTYETGKADLTKFVKQPGKRGRTAIDGPLMKHFAGKRLLVVFDESTKVKNRSADNYKSYYRSLGQLRRKDITRVLELSATPLEKDYEDAYNQLRLANPKAMPLVGEFEDYFISGRDPYGRPRYHRDRMPEFAKIAAPLILHKRKTDPDVIAEFPAKVEESRWFEMAEDQRDLYEMLCDLQPPGEEPLPGLHQIKRMVCNHPASIIHSATHGKSVLARALLEELGEGYLRSVSSVKEQGLLDYLEPLVGGQGAKVVVFSFFGPSVLPLLATALRKKKYRVFTTTGGMSTDDISRERGNFKTLDGPAVLLTSDAGARGVNLPEASYVCEFESALTYATRTQRLNRIHRIGHGSASVHCMTFAIRQSVEEVVLDTMARRNEQHDVLLESETDQENFISAAERRAALGIARSPRTRARAARPASQT